MKYEKLMVLSAKCEGFADYQKTRASVDNLRKAEKKLLDALESISEKASAYLKKEDGSCDQDLLAACDSFTAVREIFDQASRVFQERADAVLKKTAQAGDQTL